ncbi:MAG: TIGR01777 family oxidoreductase [Deltaproteobacteria bacterium]|nr:TIGR01777 family oxidoreductase [Deltaproteobacteria bacterium]
MKIFITGATGFVGTYLSGRYLEKGWHVQATGTSPEHALSGRENFEYISVDTTEKGEWQLAVKDADAIVNLAGRNIFNFWTQDYKSRIYDSRILTTRNLVDALDPGRDVTLLSASAAGYYGSRGDDVLAESASPGDDFLARVCVDWEAEALKAGQKGARVALMRFGVVMGKGGGALAKMMPAFKFFMGGPLGSGMHWFPWLHLDDLTAATIFLLQKENADGAFNFCAPNAVRYREFSRTLGQVLRRPSFMKTPAFLLKLITGEMGAAMLSSQRTDSGKLKEAGFSFRYPTLDGALREIIR